MPSFDSEKAAELHREIHSHLPSDPALRVKTLESLAVERGLVSPSSIDAWIEAYSEHIGPKRGAQVVARSWTDPEFRQRFVGRCGKRDRRIWVSGQRDRTSQGHRKHRRAAQYRGLHPVLLLPICDPWHVACMVQICRISRTRGAGTAQGVTGIRCIAA